MNNLDRFPSELLAVIVSHVDNKNELYQCALTNKSLYTKAMPLLWRELTIDTNNLLIKITKTIKETRTTSSSLGEHVRNVTLNFGTLSDTALLTFIQHVPLLEQLRLENASNLSDTSLQPIISTYCPLLTTLYISNNANAITPLFLNALDQHAHHYPLAILELEDCHGLDTDMFLALRHCPSLKVLALKRCPLGGMNDPVVAHDVAMLLSTQFPHLTTLRIQDDTNNYTALISTTNITYPSYLTQFSLDACDDLDDAAAIGFIQRHPQLTHLHLRNSPHVTDATLAAIPRWLSNIQSIRVQNMPRLTATGVCRLVKATATTVNEPVCFDGAQIYTYDDDYPAGIDLRHSAYEADEKGHELCWLRAAAFDTDNYAWWMRNKDRLKKQTRENNNDNDNWDRYYSDWN